MADKPERKKGETSENMRTSNATITRTEAKSVHAISAYFMLLYATAIEFYFFAKKRQTPRSERRAIGDRVKLRSAEISRTTELNCEQIAMH